MDEISQSPPAAGRPRSETTRRALLAAAERLVLMRGYEAVTVAEIAAEAGAGKQTIYRWWPGKAHLVLDALEAVGATHVGTAETMPLATPAVFFRRVCAAAARAAPALRSVMAAAQSDATLRKLLFNRLVTHRREAFDSVLLAAGIAEARRREALILALYGALWYRLLLDEPLDELFADQMVELIKTDNCP
jgi:AcrR family transcriptional regulator